MKNCYIFFGLFCLNVASVFAQKTAPNVIVILVDDMGYSDIGIFGSEIKRLTLIDSAKKGRFSRNFTMLVVAAPAEPRSSRACIHIRRAWDLW